MGNRAMAQLKTKDGSLYFYTHWFGAELPELVQIAMDKAKVRKGDDAYALKIVVDELIYACGARDAETGAGLMLKPNAEDEYNRDKPSVVADLSTWRVTARRRPQRTKDGLFEEDVYERG